MMEKGTTMQQKVIEKIKKLNGVGKQLKRVFGSAQWEQTMKNLLSVSQRMEQLTTESSIREVISADEDFRETMKRLTEQLDQLQFSQSN